MRIGVSSAGRWWVSMGPVGWLILLPVALAWVAVLSLAWLAQGIAWACRAVASRRD